MKSLITQIIELAVNAPSGHNSQPWRFVIHNELIFIWNIPDRDKILFNYQQRGSLIAIGALIENICIIASNKGYTSNIQLFPERNELNLIARIQLIKSIARYIYEDLFPYILLRKTNRKPYQKRALLLQDRGKLDLIAKATRELGFEILYDEGLESIRLLAEAFSMGDRLIFENPIVHKALFSNVNWTREQEEIKREGLYIRTKELSSVEQKLFKHILSNWDIIRYLKIFNLSKKAAAKRQKLYQRTSAIGLIVAPGDKPEYFVQSGRILQRFWLTVTSLGLNLQPLSVGLLYLVQRINQEAMEELDLEQKEFIKDAYKKIENIFNLSEVTPTFSFRIGYADLPTVSSLKKQPNISYLDD